MVGRGEVRGVVLRRGRGSGGKRVGLSFSRGFLGKSYFGVEFLFFVCYIDFWDM